MMNLSKSQNPNFFSYWYKNKVVTEISYYQFNSNFSNFVYKIIKIYRLYTGNENNDKMPFINKL